MTDSPPEIVALGSGRMGRGIAQVFAYAGYDVAMVDFKARSKTESAALGAAALSEIAGNLRFLASLGVLPEVQIDIILSRITVANREDGDELLSRAKFIFEGVPERLEAKQDALTRVAALASKDAVIASTTSTILVDTLAGYVDRPERFLNAHWLNPANLIPLVEVSPSSQTDPAIVRSLMDLLRAAGKKPIQCKASPGYIVPRIQAVAMNEAARMVEEGVASAAEIDEAIQTGFGIRYATMGLVEFIDWGGVDILYYASRYLQDALGSDRFAAPAVVNQLMADGHTGLQAGKGFYDYSDQDVEAFKQEKLSRFVKLLSHLDMLPPPGNGGQGSG